MTNRLIATLLVISLAACSSAQRLAATPPSGPGDTTVNVGAYEKEKADTGPEAERGSDKPREPPDPAKDEKSHLTEIGKGLVLVSLIALMAWLNYRTVCSYPPHCR